MEKVLLILALTISFLGVSQTNYEQGMQQALQLWGEGNTTEASALFERIAGVEENNWLPNYYVALVNTTQAFQTKEPGASMALLHKAQEKLDAIKDTQENNVEVLVLQAMIYTAHIARDPMTNGQSLSGKVMQLYGKAEALAPQNPRVVLNKAQFEMGTAQFFGTDTAPICANIEQSLELFDTFKPESPFHPSWGKNQAEQALKSCK
ncbi:MAG: hypothetical protein NXH73_08675 [Flavobacteriaceae bacterium]|nr:hypothetical protein [Flavobacteriaceae bacterium]